MPSVLDKELADHLAEPFPNSVVKGIDYGEVDPVMIGSDIYGWSSQVASGRPLAAIERERLSEARDELSRSMAHFPEEARPYYEHLVRIADLALRAAS